MELVTQVIPVTSRQGHETLIMPIGDIQWYGDKEGVALGMLKRHVQWGVERDALFIGMGDYVDFTSPSNRQRLRGAALYDTALSVLDQKAQQLVEELYEEALAPSKGKWLGLLEGHHYHQFANGMTTDMLLADMLGTRHLGTEAYVRLMFRRSSTTGRSIGGTHQVLIYAHHGSGTGQTAASVLNKLMRMSSQFEGDIFLMGHLPRKDASSVDKLVPVWPQHGGEPYLLHRTKVLAGTGGFMKSRVPGSRQGIVPRGGYAEKAMYTPAALGGPLVKVRPRWKSVWGKNGKAGRELWVPDISVEL